MVILIKMNRTFEQNLKETENPEICCYNIQGSEHLTSNKSPTMANQQRNMSDEVLRTDVQ